MLSDITIKKGMLHDLYEIYKIEIPILEKKVWSLRMLYDQLLDDSNRNNWLIKKLWKDLMYCMLRNYPKEIHFIDFSINPSEQCEGFFNVLVKHFLHNILAKSSVFSEVKKNNLPTVNPHHCKDGYKALIMNCNY